MFHVGLLLWWFCCCFETGFCYVAGLKFILLMSLCLYSRHTPWCLAPLFLSNYLKFINMYKLYPLTWISVAFLYMHMVVTRSNPRKSYRRQKQNLYLNGTLWYRLYFGLLKIGLYCSLGWLQTLRAWPAAALWVFLITHRRHHTWLDCSGTCWLYWGTCLLFDIYPMAWNKNFRSLVFGILQLDLA